MTPIQVAQQNVYERKPHVMVWTDLAGVQQDIRFFHKEGAKRSCRIHNHVAERGTMARYEFDPKGERFPR